jgi:hypothetical protein
MRITRLLGGTRTAGLLGGTRAAELFGGTRAVGLLEGTRAAGFVGRMWAATLIGGVRAGIATGDQPPLLHGRHPRVIVHSYPVIRYQSGGSVTAVRATIVRPRGTAVGRTGAGIRVAAAVGCRRSRPRIAGAPVVDSGRTSRRKAWPGPLPHGELVGGTAPTHRWSVTEGNLIHPRAEWHQRLNHRSVGRTRRRCRCCFWCRPDDGPPGHGRGPIAARANRWPFGAVAGIPLARSGRRPLVGGRPYPGRFVRTAPPVDTTHAGCPALESEPGRAGHR